MHLHSYDENSKGFFKYKEKQMHCFEIIDKLIKTRNQGGSKIEIRDTSEIIYIYILAALSKII